MPHLPNRRSIRLKGYNYRQEGMYLITICCYNRACLFGNVRDGKMRLNEYGQVAHNEWLKLPDRFNQMEKDVFQIMPNHMHAIVSLSASVGAALAAARNNETNPSVHEQRAGASPAPTESFDDTLGDIVGAYKSLVANACLHLFRCKHSRKGINPSAIPTMGKIWQRNYYEHIIRNTTAYLRKTEYIKNKPANWERDEFYKLD